MELCRGGLEIAWPIRVLDSLVLLPCGVFGGSEDDELEQICEGFGDRALGVLGVESDIGLVVRDVQNTSFRLNLFGDLLE
mgnify:CR=1 FL=1